MADIILPKSGIYCIRNTVSGRIYVGSAIKIRSRWNQHRHMLRTGIHHSKKLQRSWNKHGESAFVFEILEAITEVTKLVQREQFWIHQLNAACPTRGLNIHPTAGSPLGTKVSSETRAKMSAQRKGKKRPPFSAEHRANIAAARRFTKLSEETRAKQSAAKLGRKLGPQTKEHKENLSAAHKGRKRSIESRIKQGLTTKGRKLPPERLARHREILVARNRSPENREKVRAKLVGVAVSTPESRLKQSLAMRARYKRETTGDLSNQMELFSNTAGE